MADFQVLLDIQREVGELRGEMTGIGREIGDIKRLLECKTNDCRACRDGIDNELQAQADFLNQRIDRQDKKIAPLESLHVGEKAVGSWLDTGLGRIAVALSIISGVGSLFILVVWPVLQKVL
ncbi:MAG: hypothetical protein WC379_16860 [Methanoregula sp.]|jgi:hypothetical protein